MKKIRSIVSVMLTLAAVITCFSACTMPESGNQNGDGDEGKDDVKGFDVRGYRIVVPTRCSEEVSSFADLFKDRLEDYIGIKLPASDDWHEEGEDVDSVKEILIGETNRSATEKAKEKLDSIDSKNIYIIQNIGNKIVILGKNDASLIRALKYFLANFAKTSKQEGTLNIDEKYSDMNKADVNTLMLDNMVELKMDDVYTVYNPGDFDTSTIQYPKSVILKYQSNETDNGKIIATLNSGEAFYRILRSEDDGNTWKQITQVRDTYNTDLQGGRMPMLYELPVDFGDYKKGTVFLAGTSSPVGGSNAKYEKTAITIYCTTDLGETWTALPSVDYGAGKIDGNGVWEPFLIYEEETDRIYCFYSDATGDHKDPVDPKPDQKLVYKYTTDFKTWVGMDGKTDPTDDPFEAVACADVNMRPGMISIAKMGNGEYIMTYEMVGFSMNPTYAKRTKRLDDWGNPADYGTEVLSTEGHSFGSSPWCAWSSVGGECGTLVVVGKHRVQNKSDKSAPPIFLSFDYGKTYIEIENPIGYTINDINRCGYGPCVMFSADGKTLYYFTNPNKKLLADYAYIAMTRIEIIE